MMPPQKICPPGNYGCDLIWKRVFADVIKDLEMRPSWISGWTLNPMTSVLIRDRRGEDTDTQRRSPFENGGRDGREAATRQGTPGATKSWKRQGRNLP